MEPQLPLNAQAFFTANKPKAYIYSKQDIQSNRVLSGREVVAMSNNGENVQIQPAHQVQPHLQPRIHEQKPVSTINTTQPRIVVKAQRTSPAITQQTPKSAYSVCMYVKKTINSGCNCANVECTNPDCPLSKILKNNNRKRLNTVNCRKENCRWYTPK